MDSRLDSYFPPLTPDSASLRKYTDLEIQQIASILQDHENESWSKVPRTYIVLRIIQRLDLLNDLLCFGFTDFWFPVQARSLPPNIPSSTRNAFVKTQTVILTKSFDLEKDYGKHRHFAKGDPLPFDIRDRLGSGAFSEVNRIRSSISFKECAETYPPPCRFRERRQRRLAAVHHGHENHQITAASSHRGVCWQLHRPQLSRLNHVAGSRDESHTISGKNPNHRAEQARSRSVEKLYWMSRNSTRVPTQFLHTTQGHKTPEYLDQQCENPIHRLRAIQGLLRRG